MTTEREKTLTDAARKVIAHVENFYEEHLPGCGADREEGLPCDCGLDFLRAAVAAPVKRKGPEGDPYLDSRAAPFKGRVGDELLDEIRSVIDRAYADGFSDGVEEGGDQ